MSTINQSDGFTRTATVRAIEAVANSYHVTFQTRLDGTRFPNEFRQEYSFTTDRAGLEALGSEIYSCLSQQKV